MTPNDAVDVLLTDESLDIFVLSLSSPVDNALSSLYVHTSVSEARKSHNIKIPNRYFENVAKLKYLGKIVTS
jgi:hypothetical protein